MNLICIEAIRKLVDMYISRQAFGQVTEWAEMLEGFGERVSTQPARFFTKDGEFYNEFSTLLEAARVEVLNYDYRDIDAEYDALSSDDLKHRLAPQLNLLAAYARLAVTCVEGDPIAFAADAYNDVVNGTTTDLAHVEQMHSFAELLLDGWGDGSFDYLSKLTISDTDNERFAIITEYDLQARDSAGWTPGFHLLALIQFALGDGLPRDIAGTIHEIFFSDRYEAKLADLRLPVIAPFIDAFGDLLADRVTTPEQDAVFLRAVNFTLDWPGMSPEPAPFIAGLRHVLGEAWDYEEAFSNPGRVQRFYDEAEVGDYAQAAAQYVLIKPEDTVARLEDYFSAVSHTDIVDLTMFEQVAVLDRNLQILASVETELRTPDAPTWERAFAQASVLSPAFAAISEDLQTFAFSHHLRRIDVHDRLVVPAQDRTDKAMAFVLPAVLDRALDPVQAQIQAAVDGARMDVLDDLQAKAGSLSASEQPLVTVQQLLTVWPEMRSAKQAWLTIARLSTVQQDMPDIAAQIATVIADAKTTLNTVGLLVPAMYRVMDEAVARDDKSMIDNNISVLDLIQSSNNASYCWHDLGDQGVNICMQISEDARLMGILKDELGMMVLMFVQHQKFLKRIDRIKSDLGNMANGISSPGQSIHADARLDRLLDWITRVANTEAVDHESFHRYLQEDFAGVDVFKQDLDYFDGYLAQYATELLTRVHSQPAYTMAWRSMLRGGALDAIYRRVGMASPVSGVPTDEMAEATANAEAAHNVDVEFALLRAIDFGLDALRDQKRFADFSANWFSVPARAWNAKLGPPNPAIAAGQKVTETTALLQEFWIKRDTDTQVFKAEHTKNRSWKLVGQAFELACLSPAYILANLIERLPEFERSLEVDAPDEDLPTGFTALYQVDFKFHNELGEAMLSSIVAQEMVLEIINPLDSDIVVGEPRDMPEAEGKPCHFTLRFRAGTLDGSLANIAMIAPHSDEGDWEIVDRISRQIGGAVIDELLIKAPVGHTIKAGSSRHLLFTEVQGVDSGRRSSRVLLIYHGLTTKGEDMASGHREKLLTVVNQMPFSERQAFALPLEVEFVSADTVISDGIVPNTLKIALTSMAQASHRRQVKFDKFQTDGDRVSWRRTKIIVSIDTADAGYGDEMDWALCANSEAPSIGVSLTHKAAGQDWDWVFTGQGTRAQWVFAVPPGYEDEDLILPRRKSLELELSGIVTSMPDGPAYVHVQCVDFPGFPDRDYRLRLQKRKRDMPLGTMMPFAGTTAPPGWLMCHGQDVPTEAPYNELRDMLGAHQWNYGFPDRATKLPNMKARTIVGLGPELDHSSIDDTEPFQHGVDAVQLGARAGVWEHALTDREVPQHTHAIIVSEMDREYVVAIDKEKTHAAITWSHSQMEQEHATPVTHGAHTTSAALTHRNVQPFYAVNYIIKY